MKVGIRTLYAADQWCGCTPGLSEEQEAGFRKIGLTNARWR